MAHSFVAYIDESGDEGFSFRPEPGKGSSEWLVISAVMGPMHGHIAEMKRFHDVIRPMEITRGSPIHFAKLPHDQRIPVCDALGHSNFRLLSICIHKPSLLASCVIGPAVVREIPADESVLASVVRHQASLAGNVRL